MSKVKNPKVGGIQRYHDVRIVKVGTPKDCVHHEFLKPDKFVTSRLVGTCKKCGQIRWYDKPAATVENKKRD